MTPILFLQWGFALLLTFLAGKLISKLKLPAILGWLIAGMILGPNALSLVPEKLLNADWYETVISLLECCVGLMIGTELVWGRLKQYGKALFLTTLSQSLGTFFLVSAAFALIFYFLGLPIYPAFILGGVALATAPAPALSIVREFKTKGPVTQTLIPMAALDDMVGVVVFFTVIAVIARSLSSSSMSVFMIPVIVLLPLVIGVITGFPAGFLLKKERPKALTMLTLGIMILITAVIGFLLNHFVMPAPVLNFMLMGMSFSAVFANMIPEERLEVIMKDFNPVLGLAMMIVILNLGAPLDYHAILGAGAFTAVYIFVRSIGKYFGARLGAKATGLPVPVQKYLGLTLLPHSGVSLVFTGIAVSVLKGPAPDSALMIQGTIAAAAVINEVIAVIAAKKGFEWAGEFHRLSQSTSEASLSRSDLP